MVATIASEQQQIDESISTCRFAERVAMVRNVVAVNEEVDPTLVIRRLKTEIRDLKEEVRLLRGEDEQRGALTPDEISRLQKQVIDDCLWLEHKSSTLECQQYLAHHSPFAD